jgi:hypothetical protein
LGVFDGGVNRTQSHSNSRTLITVVPYVCGQCVDTVAFSLTLKVVVSSHTALLTARFPVMNRPDHIKPDYYPSSPLKTHLEPLQFLRMSLNSPDSFMFTVGKLGAPLIIALRNSWNELRRRCWHGGEPITFQTHPASRFLH